VPSVEDTAAWYERILGRKGHFDTFNEAGQLN
jgi:catechol 2,3-dioxygenase-like lactoylglutathione lyase family enzyme